MESTPNIKKYVYQPHRKGSALNIYEKRIVMNVFHKMVELNPSCSLNDMLRKTSELTGVSTRSIIRMRKDYSETGTFSAPGKSGRKRPTENPKEKRKSKSASPQQKNKKAEASAALPKATAPPSRPSSLKKTGDEQEIRDSLKQELSLTGLTMVGEVIKYESVMK